ncbi:hypothetical protein KAI58_03685 [Candidatus Gracilibacteria bacterium]|nr:hypothetical protein [Candidatus Gracilibacteria bacterium]
MSIKEKISVGELEVGADTLPVKDDQINENVKIVADSVGDITNSEYETDPVVEWVEAYYPFTTLSFQNVMKIYRKRYKEEKEKGKDFFSIGTDSILFNNILSVVNAAIDIGMEKEDCFFLIWKLGLNLEFVEFKDLKKVIDKNFYRHEQTKQQKDEFLNSNDIRNTLTDFWRDISVFDKSNKFCMDLNDFIVWEIVDSLSFDLKLKYAEYPEKMREGISECILDSIQKNPKAFEDLLELQHDISKRSDSGETDQKASFKRIFTNELLKEMFNVTASKKGVVGV